MTWLIGQKSDKLNVQQATAVRRPGSASDSGQAGLALRRSGQTRGGSEHIWNLNYPPNLGHNADWNSI